MTQLYCRVTPTVSALGYNVVDVYYVGIDDSVDIHLLLLVLILVIGMVALLISVIINWWYDVDVYGGDLTM